MGGRKEGGEGREGRLGKEGRKGEEKGVGTENVSPTFLKRGYASGAIYI
jgi:hypothetical protein